MAGWFPQNTDGGIPPSSDPNNPASAFAPATPPISTAALYFGSGCDVRLRPHVVNSLISENLAVVDRVGLNYNPGILTNLRTAIEYVVQRGLPKYAVLHASGVPTNYYTGGLDPPLRGGYNNGMVLCVVPNAANQGFVRIDLGGGWWVPVLRNDYQELEAGDLPANVPQVVAYFNGAFFMLGISNSQVPIILKGAINFWIRPDGNDTTGDGTENTPAKAFRTIDGAWSAVGSRYAATPGAHIALRLGIPGTYEAGHIGPYGAAVSLTGDVANRGAYRIVSDNNPFATVSLIGSGINSLSLRGISLSLTFAGGTGASILRLGNCNTLLDRIQLTVEVSHPNAYVILLEGGGLGAGIDQFTQDDIRIVGNGRTVGNGIGAWWAAMASGTDGWMPPTLWHWENIVFNGSGYAAAYSSSITLGNHIMSLANTVGPKYAATANSTISTGQPYPGNAPGTVGPFSTAGPG